MSSLPRLLQLPAFGGNDLIDNIGRVWDLHGVMQRENVGQHCAECGEKFRACIAVAKS